MKGDRQACKSRSIFPNTALVLCQTGVPPAGFKYLVTEMVCWAAGGPQKYTGKSMVDSHAHLKITSKEWEAFLDDPQQTLDKFAVPAQEQAELKAIVNSTRADIVAGSAPGRSANS